MWLRSSGTSYSHEASRNKLPYMGRLEMDFRWEWTRSWGMTSDVMDILPETLVEACAAADQIMDHIGSWLSTLQPIYTSAVNLGAEKAAPFEKARNPFRRGTPSWAWWNERNGLIPNLNVDPATRYANIAKNLSLDLVQNITGEAKRVVRQALYRAHSLKLAPEDIGPTISSVVGLSPRWAKAVENLRQSMTDQGIPKRTVTRRANAYGKQLLAKRGIMVARTELMRAQNAGEYEEWQIRADAGLLQKYVVVKTWNTRPGACVECIDAQDKMASGSADEVEGLRTPFKTAYGDVLYPPLHPHCGCTITYKTVIGPGAEALPR